MALKLIKIAGDERANTGAAADRARAGLAEADTRLQDAAAAHAGARTTLAELSGEDARLRRALATLPEGADATSAAEALDVNAVALRHRSMALAAAAIRLEEARRARGRAAAALERAEAAARRALELELEAVARESRLAAAEAALAAAPLSEVPAAAGKAAGDATAKAADKKLADNVPEPLRKGAAARLAALTEARAATAQGAAAGRDAVAGVNGADAAVAALAGRMSAADEAYLRRLADVEALAQARVAIAAVAALPDLAEAQRKRLTTGPVADAGKAAVKAVGDRDKALAELNAAELKLADARLQATVADPVKPEPPDVVTAREAVTTAEARLRAADEALDVEPAGDQPAPRVAFGRWAARVPEALWSALVALERARAELQRLQEKPSTLLDAARAAEDAYATALTARLSAARAAEARVALAAERAAAAEVASRTTSDLGAARGDA